MKFYTLESSYDGNIAENTEYTALARCSRDKLREPEEREMIPMPYASEIHFLKHRDPMGIKKGKKTHYFTSYGEQVCAVAFIPPPGFTRTLLPAYHIKKNVLLPFFAYTMGAFAEENLYIAAVKTDSSLRWEPSQYNSPDLKRKIEIKIKKYKNNRLIKHLAACALDYGCYNAQNIFYDRWEGGIPVSVSCNAGCLGCISKKRPAKLQSPQSRISFVPSVEEILEIAVPHLRMGRSIISFGQGCEGEPLTQADLIADSIRRIRMETDRGTLHMNTNGINFQGALKVIEAGIDSIRVSMNSAVEDTYSHYFDISARNLTYLKKTIRAAKDAGVFVSVNYLVMPGVNDNEREAEVFLNFLGEYKPDMIQMRNLNIDPELYFQKMPTLQGKALGIVNLLDLFKKEYENILIGNFNVPLKD